MNGDQNIITPNFTQKRPFEYQAVINAITTLSIIEEMDLKKDTKLAAAMLDLQDKICNILNKVSDEHKEVTSS